MRRRFIKGILAGCALVAMPASACQLFNTRSQDRCSRIADDALLTGTAQRNMNMGVAGVQLLRSCDASAVMRDAVCEDHAVSALVRLEQRSTSQLNCMTGRARVQRVPSAISDREHTTHFYELAGNWTASTRSPSSDRATGTCQKKNLG